METLRLRVTATACVGAGALIALAWLIGGTPGSPGRAARNDVVQLAPAERPSPAHVPALLVPAGYVERRSAVESVPQPAPEKALSAERLLARDRAALDAFNTAREREEDPTIRQPEAVELARRRLEHRVALREREIAHLKAGPSIP